jgi:hypothetical protein
MAKQGPPKGTNRGGRANETVRTTHGPVTSAEDHLTHREILE